MKIGVLASSSKSSASGLHSRAETDSHTIINICQLIESYCGWVLGCLGMLNAPRDLFFVQLRSTISIAIRNFVNRNIDTTFVSIAIMHLFLSLWWSAWWTGALLSRVSVNVFDNADNECLVYLAIAKLKCKIKSQIYGSHKYYVFNCKVFANEMRYDPSRSRCPDKNCVSVDFDANNWLS